MFLKYVFDIVNVVEELENLEEPKDMQADSDKAEERECIICKETLQDGSGSEEVMTLECMHRFHKICLPRYAEAKKCNIMEACPFKCSVQYQHVFGDEIDIGSEGFPDGDTVGESPFPVALGVPADPEVAALAAEAQYLEVMS